MLLRYICAPYRIVRIGRKQELFTIEHGAILAGFKIVSLHLRDDDEFGAQNDVPDTPLVRNI
jgi:hypothetical protein